MNAVTQTNGPQATREFSITRLFDAPRTLVWECFTDPEHMKQWWGPKGSTIIASNMDLRVGGIYHGAIRAAEGLMMWAKFVYREIVAPELFVYEHALSNEARSVTRHPLIPTWPFEFLTTVTFEELPGGKTKLTLRWSPLNASERERKTFDASREIMRSGWGSTFDQLATYLEGMRARREKRA